MSEIDPTATVTVESDGRSLSGVGVTPESLQETIDARTPDAPEASADPTRSHPIPHDPASAGGSPSAPVKPTRGQARFSELTQKAKDAEARAAAAEKKAAELEARVSAPASSAPRGPQEAPGAAHGGPGGGEPPAPAPPVLTRPEPSEDAIGPGLTYETYGAFVKDQAQWVWEQQQSAIDARVRAGIDGHQQQQAFLSHVERTRAKGRASYPDFDTLLQSGPGTYVPMPAPAVQAIFALPNTEHVQYAIMKDAALAQELAQLAATSPYQFGLRVAQLAPLASAAPPASTAATPLPPPPMQPVGAGGTTTRTHSAEHAKAGNYEAYRLARLAERGERRR